jgi:CRP/FNR family transcriptional regulator, cyclic AMP receptor protein
MNARHLETIELFAGLSRRGREEVARQADEVDIDTGEKLVSEGRFGYEFFVIEKGTAEVLRDGQQLAQLGPGDFFGEMALLGDVRRNASVVAATPMTAVVMTDRAFRALARDMPEVAERIREACRERSRSFKEI